MSEKDSIHAAFMNLRMQLQKLRDVDRVRPAGAIDELVNETVMVGISILENVALDINRAARALEQMPRLPGGGR